MSGCQFQFPGSKDWDLPGGGRDPSSSPCLHPQTARGPLPEAWQTGEKSSKHVKICFVLCWSKKYIMNHVNVPVPHIGFAESRTNEQTGKGGIWWSWRGVVNRRCRVLIVKPSILQPHLPAATSCRILFMMLDLRICIKTWIVKK